LRLKFLACTAILASLAEAQTASSVTFASSANPSTLGQQVILSAAVTSGATGKVTFYDGTTVLGTSTLSGNHAALTTVLLPAGARSLHAHYLGDSNYLPSNSIVVMQTVTAGVSLGLKPPAAFSPISYPQALAIADFNGDGKPDLVTANTSSFSVSLGNGDGTFQPALTSTAAGGSMPQSMAVADFNGDGKADIALLNYYTSKLNILLGNGDGTFQAPTTYTVPSSSSSIATADFNGDGKPDLVIASSYSGTIGVYLGNGDGTFGAARTLNFTDPMSVSVGDLNGDGKADLVLLSYGSPALYILLGNGDGTFQSATGPSLPLTTRYQTVIADFNGDGKADLAISDYFGVAVLIGNGDGTFLPAVNYGNSYDNESSVAVGDFNGDGKLDLVVGAYASGTGLVVLYGNGDGTFQAGVTFASSYTPVSVAVGDFNGDGKTDVAATYGYNGGGIAVLLGGAVPDLTISISPGAGFTQGQIGAVYLLLVSNVGQYPTTAAVGVVDTLPSGFAATAISGSGWTCVLSTLACTRSDSLAAGASYPAIRIVVNVSGSLVGNVTDNATVSGGGDQNTSNNSASLTSFVRNTSSVILTSSPNPSTLGGTVTLTATINSGATGLVAFYDGTSILGDAPIRNNQATLITDLLSPGTRRLTASWGGNTSYGPSVSAVYTQTVTETESNGLQPLRSYPTDGTPNWVAVGDLNGDGKPDLVTANGIGDVSVLLGNGDGTFQTAVNYPVASYLSAVAIGDFNGDGKPDLAIGSTTGIYILIGNGDGSFQASVIYAANTNVNALVVADFNGDGIADLAAAAGSALFIALGNGNGTFAAPLYTGFTASEVLQVADFNLDGKPDLFFGNSGSQTASIALGNGDGTFQSPTSITATGSPNAFVVGDFNNDGKPDVAITYWVGVEVFLNLGNGSWSSPIQSSLIATPGYFMVAGDFNGDGNLDIAIRGYYLPYFNIAFGNGDGTFSGGVTFNTNGYGEEYGGNIAVGDFNLDGKPDFAVANPSTTSNTPLGVDVFLGGLFSGLSITSSHARTFTAGQKGASYQITISNPGYMGSNSLVTVTDALPSGITVTAVSGTGWTCTLSTLTCTRSDTLSGGNSFPAITLTVNVSSSLSPSIINNRASVTSNTITNTFTDPTVIVGMTTTTLVLDFNGDGKQDVFLYDPVAGVGYAGLSNGSGGFTYVYSPFTPGFDAIRYGNFTNSGLSDLVAYNSTTATGYVLLGSGAGTFSSAVSLFWGPGFTKVAAGDLNGDGLTDFLIYRPTDGTSYTAISNGDGTFHYQYTLVNGGYTHVVVADFNGDGKADVFYYRSTDGLAYLGISNGAGGFTFSPVSLSAGYTFVEPGDINGDGKADLLFYSGTSGAAAVGLSAGSGFNFTPYQYSPGFTTVKVFDFDDDGFADVALYNMNNAIGYLGISNGTNAFTFSSLFWGPGFSTVDALDLNGDGKIDVVIYNTTNAAAYAGISSGNAASPFTYQYSFWGNGKVLATAAAQP
jgi:hypothetical protein